MTSILLNKRATEHAESFKLLSVRLQLHLELCRIARYINDFFGMQMTLQMLSYFVALISMFIFQYNAIVYLKLIFENDTALKIFLATNMWFIIYLIQVLLLNYICESVNTKFFSFYCFTVARLFTASYPTVTYIFKIKMIILLMNNMFSFRS
ncbi:hypothetical protein PUN28_010891 [Cardiocondyla obscurior]|uniref:Uncharacterized protein n=1 Tax=Cardiocondyla obscurior TaxID=286306 RepID=A0AAW2FNG2_9HYME